MLGITSDSGAINSYKHTKILTVELKHSNLNEVSKH